ncbi:MAG: hypothetical protein KatS3mg115_1867 [Candidatus Poribacteria bacterium]|nr:MAG: hypothetical protein KatS3mg115_1867 [Candidatus Poribacteria bacterium]
MNERSARWRALLPYLIGAAVGLALVGGLMLSLLRSPSPSKGSSAVPPDGPSESSTAWAKYRQLSAPTVRERRLILILFEPTQDGWVQEERSLAVPNSEALRVRAVVDVWLDAWRRRAPDREGVRLLAAFLPNPQTAVLDLSSQVRSALVGLDAELYFLQGLSQTLRANFPTLRRCQVLMDGEIALTLGGHLAIEEPFAIEFFAEPERWEWRSR